MSIRSRRGALTIALCGVMLAGAHVLPAAAAAPSLQVEGGAMHSPGATVSVRLPGCTDGDSVVVVDGRRFSGPGESVGVELPKWPGSYQVTGTCLRYAESISYQPQTVTVRSPLEYSMTPEVMNGPGKVTIQVGVGPQDAGKTGHWSVARDYFSCLDHKVMAQGEFVAGPDGRATITFDVTSAWDKDRWYYVTVNGENFEFFGDAEDFLRYGAPAGGEETCPVTPKGSKTAAKPAPKRELARTD